MYEYPPVLPVRLKFRLFYAGGQSPASGNPGEPLLSRMPRPGPREAGRHAGRLRLAPGIRSGLGPGFLEKRGVYQAATPEFIFDKGYLTWQGFSPLDYEINARLHQRLAPLIEENLHLYLVTLKSEWLAHVAALKAAGWRKARTA